MNKIIFLNQVHTKHRRSHSIKPWMISSGCVYV